jgi:hypothetical protein
MIATLGWQATYGVFAGLHLALALPLHLWLARQRPAPDAATPSPSAAPAPALRPLPAELAPRAFGLLATGFALSGMVIAGVTVHLVPLMQALGLGAAAYLAAMVMGPAQVAIRATDALFWKGLHPLDVALIAAAALPLSIAALTIPGGGAAAAAAFAAMLGIGGGLASIVRGTVPLALFGPAGFGGLLGRLALVRTLLSAVAPFLFAVLLARAGTATALAAAAAAGLAGLVPLVLLRGMVRRQPALGGSGHSGRAASDGRPPRGL